MKNWLRATTALASSAIFMIRPAFAQNAPVIEPIQGGGIETIIDAIQNVINWMLMIAGVLAVAYLVYAGIMYITAPGGKTDTAKNMIINAIVGIVIITLSYVIVNTAMSLMG